MPAQLFRGIGDCRLAIYVGPLAAARLFKKWAIVFEQRVQVNQWNVDSPNTGCRKCLEAANRNLARASRRLALEQATVRTGCGEGIRGDKGNIAREPPDEDFIPPIPNAIQTAHSLSQALDPNLNT